MNHGDILKNMDNKKMELARGEFFRFRWAHAKANSFLIGVFFVLIFIGSSIRWLFGKEKVNIFSWEFALVLVICGLITQTIPRLGYYLARHILFAYHTPECFGKNYKDYRIKEKIYKEKGMDKIFQTVNDQE